MQRRGSAVYVALGPAALEHALEAPLREPLLSLFCSSEAFARLMNAAGRPSRGSVSAIHAEAAPLSQMSLIRALYARRLNVGVLLSAGTRQQEPALRQAARTAGVDIDVRLIEPEEDTLRAAVRLRTSTVLLMVPDRRLYTIDNLRNVLESTYRSNQAVIGFSTSLVNAGTLAAAYSSIDDTVAQLETVAAAMAAGRHVEPQHPLYWRVAINDSVARSFNVVVTDAARGMGNFPP